MPQNNIKHIEWRLIVDTNTKGHKEIIRRLKRLVSTLDITDNGCYRECPYCSQLSITTTKTEDELDNYLWRNNLDYIGVCDDN